MSIDYLMKGLNYFIYLLALPLFLNSCKKGCTDPNAENYNPEAKKDNGSCYFINLPTNLECTITNVDNSGVVEIQATATNENFFTFIFMNATDSTIITSTNGSASYSYSSSGTYFIKTRANLTSSQYIERIDSVTISFSVNNTGYTTPLNYPNYTLSWNDEFNGTSLSNDWTHELGNGNNGWGNNELQYYREQNTSLENGYLKITAKQEYYGGKNYTSSRIKTQGNVSHTYGRIDIRAKLPFGQGIWPALWMLGENFSSVGWPSCGEIDIMEMIGGNGYNDRTVHGTAHWESNGHAEYGGSNSLSSGRFADEFHVFSIIWTPSSIVWLRDDIQYQVIDITNLSAFHNNFFFIFNLAVGGNWPGSPNASTIFDQTLLVDYIRVFQ
ncbi:MAG: glycoside hydrolase family 16 protein [Flavobacteriales bacterium]|nr:glycoside hydrolase family 16 protein [Flavobacteriales bacterium]